MNWMYRRGLLPIAQKNHHPGNPAAEIGGTSSGSCKQVLLIILPITPGA